MTSDRLIITGATGFIGSHIVNAFLEHSIRPICLVRKTSRLEWFDRSCIDIRYGDIRDAGTLRSAFQGCSVLIHNAALAYDWGRKRDFYETNVDGTLNVLNACVSNDVDHVIMTGTISSYGEEDSTVVKDETSPYNSHYRYFLDRIFPCAMNYYRDTKARATREAVRFAERHGLNLTVLEPTWVYGEREFNTGFYDYLKNAKNRFAIAPGSTKNNFHVVYAGDLARAYVLAYEKRIPGVERIIVGDETATNMDVLFSLLCAAAGLRKPATAHKYVLYPMAFLLELLYTMFRSKLPPPLTRGRVNMFYDSIQYSTRKARTVLGFSSAHKLEQGIHKTIQWYKANGLL
ncbi:MAG: NAD-dependent epimerase/dehydratase family protein [Candidatus Latescibacterota bacterium]|nr:MAG: NAD-dependent epimerase/dehydratase family protein [Candidatus Latescibacterota bacterium]